MNHVKITYIVNPPTGESRVARVAWSDPDLHARAHQIAIRAAKQFRGSTVRDSALGFNVENARTGAVLVTIEPAQE